MTIKSFDVLDRMCENDPDGNHLKAFMSPDNFIEAKTGNNGWGFVKMAVDNQTIIDMATNQKMMKFVMFVYDVDEYIKTKLVTEGETP